MMCSILLSINPKHVNNIMNGTKCYEFRKIVCRRHVDKILIYCTAKTRIYQNTSIPANLIPKF